MSRTFARTIAVVAAAILALLAAGAAIGVGGGTDDSGTYGVAPAPPLDQFTPVVVSTLAPRSAPVRGTDGKYHVVYELELVSSRGDATLQRVQVLDAAHQGSVIATYEGDALLAQLRRLDGHTLAGSAVIPSDAARLFFVELSFPSRSAVPRRLVHRLDVVTTLPGRTQPEPVSYTAGPFDLTAPVPVLGPPLAGKGWVAINGCCNSEGVHRATVLPVNGSLHVTQRFAIDWMRLDSQGRFVHGDPSDVHNYTAYGANELAIADGTVVDTLNTLDDQVPGQLPDPATITLQNIDGNHVVLDLGHGLFAFYAHMQKGSVRVHRGQHVRRGQVLGKLGNTGNTSAPHLHFHLMDGPSVLGSEGLPYVTDRFQLAGQVSETRFAAATDLTGVWNEGLFPKPSPRVRQFPLDLNIVNFPR